MEDIYWPELQPQASLTTPETPQPRTLTQKEFFATFQFAQGDLYLQDFIFMYLKDLHPELSIPLEESWAMEDASLHPAEVLVHNAQRHPPVQEKVSHALSREMATARETLNYTSMYRRSREYIVHEIADSVVRRDQKYLLQPNGRDYAPNPTGSYNPYKDSWRSDLCYFGFLGNTTGLPDFDQMFVDVAAYWRIHANDPPSPTAKMDEEATAHDMRQVVAVFNVRHAHMSDLHVDL